MPSPGDQPASALLPVLQAGEAIVEVDLGLYGKSALLRTAHRFTGRCYVALGCLPEGDAPAGETVRVTLRLRSGDAEPHDLVGEFLNELLDQALREEVARETEPVRNLLLAHALSETTLLRPDLDEVEPAADPLGVAAHQQPPARATRPTGR